jgi:hypothetical protein
VFRIQNNHRMRIGNGRHDFLSAAGEFASYSVEHVMFALEEEDDEGELDKSTGGKK